MDVELRDLIEQLRHYVQGITRDEDTANEVVQNALFKALSRGKLFPQHRGWLFTVAKHEAYKTLKRAPYAMPEAPLEAPANYHENSIVEYMHLLKNVTSFICAISISFPSKNSAPCFIGQKVQSSESSTMHGNP